MRTTRLIAVGLFALLPAPGRGDEWPQFRGPGGSATAAGKEAPAEWDAGKNVAWKAKLPGYGWSSPVVWGDKVFLTTAVSDKQRKPSGGFGPGEFGGPGGGPGGRRPGGFTPPQPGQILAPFLQGMLQLTDDQKKMLAGFQKEADGKLDKILTDDQRKQFREPAEIPGRGGFGPGGFTPPQPGQILPAAARDRLKLTDDQKKQADEIQKEVDSGLAKILTDDQQKQIKDMREAFGRGPGGGRGPGRGGFGGMQKPPDAVFKLEIYCLDRSTGDVVWKRTAFEGKPHIPTQASNTYATETPVTDGRRVYAYFGMHGVYCYDLAGELVWKKDLGSYPMAMGFGTGSSPALDGDRLFVQCDNEDKSFLVALDAATGKELWRTPRPERTGYSTPLVWKNKVRTEVVCVGTPRVRSYDPATGKQLWELGGMSGQPKASPAADAELLFVGTGGGPGGMFGGQGGPGGGRPGGPGGGEGMFGSGRPLVAVKAGASGDLTPKDGIQVGNGIAWRLPQAGPQTASPLLHDGLLYVVDDRGGLLSCYDAKSGKQVYKERLPGARSFTSSPWAAGGKVFCLDDAGTTFVVKAGPSFKMLGKNAVGEMCWSSPAVAGSALFLRTVDHLFCIKSTSDK